MDLATGERVIYPSGWRSAGSQLVALSLVKLLRGIGLFLLFDLLHVVQTVHLLFVIRAGTSILLWILQRPLSPTAGPPLLRGQYFRVLRHAAFAVFLDVLWLTGLSFCGPLRFILLYEHADIIVLTAASTLYFGTGGPSKTRGSVFFLFGVLGLLFLDHDSTGELGQHPEGRHSSEISHSIYSIVAWLGLADHKAGVLLLLLALCLTAGFNHVAKSLGVAIGGAKRLHALSTAAGTILLIPWLIYSYFASMIRSTPSMSVESPLHQLFALLFVIFIVFVLDYYISALATSKLGALPSARYASLTLCTAGLLLAFLWNHPMTSSDGIDKPTNVEHQLSSGLLLSFGVVFYAIILLTGPARTTGSQAANFIGYSAGGLPLYMQGRGQASQNNPQSLLQLAKTGLTQILADRNSRSIFYFLCLNLAFTGVELVYGAWTNSLGLISDGFHMFFDCAALVMGLYASVLARWKPTRVFTFGYDRVEVLSGFVNGLFLVVISVFILLSAFGRLVDPPPINTEKLMIVSVGGLLVNMVGLCAFSHAHTHGGSTCPGHAPSGTGSAQTHGHSHNKQHGHCHDTPTHGHSHEAVPHAHVETYSNNTNMQGVFLHVMADTLGSVGVIVSSFLVSRWGLLVADPLCSIFIAILIILSVLPLLRDTLAILSLDTPSHVKHLLDKMAELDGVVRLRNPHLWRHTGSVSAATVHIFVSNECSEQRVLGQARQLLKQAGYHHVTIQVEKDAFHQHMGAMGITVESHEEIDRDTCKPTISVQSL